MKKPTLKQQIILLEAKLEQANNRLTGMKWYYDRLEKRFFQYIEETQSKVKMDWGKMCDE